MRLRADRFVLHLGPDDSLWFGELAARFDDSGRCKYVVHSQVMTFNELLGNLHHLRDQTPQSVLKRLLSSNNFC